MPTSGALRCRAPGRCRPLTGGHGEARVRGCGRGRVGSGDGFLRGGWVFKGIHK